ncbi:MAG: ferric reductase-like transmembrane domain-containing protein [Candidatus Woesebacteria bacterium]|nr:MAG: ferric reductase-like transmembrane domain-containing protein [Candidatus Woesebacteria bacterium]
MITGLLYLFSKINQPTFPEFWIILAQVSGLFGTLFLSWNYIVSVRHMILEKIFGGLDRVYKTHEFFGISSFILLLNHPLFLIINFLPFNSTSLYLLPGRNLAYTFGVLSLYSLFLLVSFTIFVKLPYRFWKLTHEWTGIVILLALFHAYLIPSDISRYLPLRIWILSWNSLAILAFIYKRFLYYFLAPKKTYVVENVVQDSNYLVLTLIGDRQNFLRFNPGQFAFFTINGKGADREEHPFSILEQKDNYIKIGVKVIGNFTLKLTDLKDGDTITVRGPFGNFGEKVQEAKEMVWISGGIGITPFLSMAPSIMPDQKVTMIHTSANPESRLLTDKLTEHAVVNPSFRFINHLTSLYGRLNADNVCRRFNLTRNSYVFLCGPKKMMETFAEQFSSYGISRKRIIYEDFQLR